MLGRARADGLRLECGRSVTPGAVVPATDGGTRRLLGPLPPGEVPPLLHGTGFPVETERERLPGFAHVIRTPTRSGACGACTLSRT